MPRPEKPEPTMAMSVVVVHRAAFDYRISYGYCNIPVT